MTRADRRKFAAGHRFLVWQRSGRIVALLVLGALSSGCRERGGELASVPVVQMVTPDGFTLVVESGKPDMIVAELVDATGKASSRASVAEQDGRLVALAFSELEPDTSYRYALREGDKELASEAVRTAPLGQRDFRFLAFGDSGTGDSEQYRLAKLMPPLKPDLVVHVGDLIYPDGEAKDYARKFNVPYAGLIRRAPFYPVIGNHDYRTAQGEPLLDYFVLPRNGPSSQKPEQHYYFDYGEVRFVGIDTDVSGDVIRDEIGPWLDRVLEEHTGKWKVVFFHHPMYTHAFYASAHRIRSVFQPIFEARGVDLVLQGHNHLYERTYPLLVNRVMPEGGGVVYVTTGGGGGELYPAKKEADPQFARQYDEKHSFTVVDVRADEMALRQIDTDGKTVDQFKVLDYSPTPVSSTP
ncbi:MAG: metallophosphoesterase [Phycisphaerae bacterium]|nr:metallophosphoesterase [Phycisphaerae bacterium]